MRSSLPMKETSNMSTQRKSAAWVQENHPHQVELSRRTHGEHDDLLDCLHRLEAALASPAPGREREWANRAASELREVEASLRRHIASAEGERGLFAELDLSQGSIPARVEALREDHDRLLADVSRLAERLARGDWKDYLSIRQEAELLLAGLRRHHSSEVDLIFECFWLDIGVGD
jgi:hypothetical protein